MAEFWARNPFGYVRECIKANQTNFTFSEGLLTKLNYDPYAWATLNYPNDFRCIIVGARGAVEITRSHPVQQPRAIYPVWEHGQNTLIELEDWISTPIEDKNPEHRVVVTALPNLQTRVGKKVVSLISELQFEYPNCIVHVHYAQAPATLLSCGFGAFDMDIRRVAGHGRVVLPNGRTVVIEEAGKYRKWINLAGISSTIDGPKEACVASILAMQWAAKHWLDPTPYKSTYRALTDEDFDRILQGFNREPDQLASMNLVSEGQPMAGDKLACDYCSFARSCSVFRVGSVCTLPKSDGSDLVKHFQTRSSEAIIEGLGKLLEIDFERLVEGREQERATQELSKEVTGISKDLFNKGVQLAKLVDPALRPGGINVNVGVKGDNTSVALDHRSEATPQVMASRAIELLEQNGIPRADMTTDMIKRVVNGEHREVIAEYNGGGILELPHPEIT